MIQQINAATAENIPSVGMIEQAQRMQ